MVALAAAELLHALSRAAVGGLAATMAIWAAGGSAALSAEIYWDGAREGWFWYEDPPAAPPPREAEPAPPPPPADPADPAVREALKRWPVDETVLPRLPVKWLRALQEVKLERALEEFSPVVTRDYILVHQEHFRRSQDFADLWQLVLVTNPALDPESRRPTSTAGLQVADALDREERERTLAAWGERAGLFFYFTSQCPYCKRFAPVVKLFADQHGWTVFPVTQDGRTLPEFPDARPDNGMGEAIGVRSVPALFLSIPEERFLAPVGQGFLTLSQLEERVLTILRQRGRMNAG